MRLQTRSIALCLMGIALQATGVVLVFRPGTAELNLILGGFVYLLGTVPLMYIVERRAEQKGRRGAWSLVSFFGPGALLLLRVLRPAESDRGSPKSSPLFRRTGLDRVIGVAVTILATVGFVWAGMQWINRDRWPPEPPASRIPRNEQRAFERLRTIADAQQRYHEADRDGDGKTGYARFLVHLWRGVDREGHPVEVNLIPRRLAFAMEDAFALDGYVYRDLYERELAPDAAPSDGGSSSNPRSRPLSPETEWSVAAMPVVPGKTGRLAFITDNSGKIWAKEIRDSLLSIFPHAPSANGWIEISSDADLLGLQKSHRNSEK